MLLLYSFLFITGACIGSFITCMAERTCAQVSPFAQVRSICPQCAHPLRVWQLIPIVGVVLQRGRCFDCHHTISLRSSYVEVLCGILLIVSFSQTQISNWSLLFGYAILLFNSVTDQLTFAVYPSTLIVPGVLGLIQQPPQLTIPLLILLGLLLTLYLLARFTTKFGMGDVEVLGLLACLASPTAVITSLTLATGAALIVFSCRPRSVRLPFVPFITWGFISYTQLIH